MLLYTAPLSRRAKARLKAMRETSDGFEIARRDLEIRGPGELLGARQSGAALLRFADPLQDEALLLEARRVAETLLETDPAAAERHIARWLGGRVAFPERLKGLSRGVTAITHHPRVRGGRAEGGVGAVHR